MKKLVACILTAALLLTQLAGALAATYTPGEYTVTVPGHNGDVTVTVVTTEDAIADIKLGVNTETQGLGDTAMAAVIAQIIEKNSAEVDAVTNATVSSNAVIEAVKIALARAEKGEVDAAAEAETAADVLTFHDQCVAAGIAHTYVDPNAHIYDFETTDPTVDVLTHASGPAKYVDETDGPCIKTEADLVARSATKTAVYYWELNEEEGVATLAEAAALENAQYVSRPFPNDGQKYALLVRNNSLGTNVVVTVDGEGMPYAAVYGLSWKLEKNGTDCYASCAIMAETATMQNILNGSPILITYYEYNAYSELKIGVGNRNAGARLYCELDEERATLTFNDKDADGNAIKMTVAEYRALDEETRNSLSIRYLSIVAPVVELTSIG